VRTAEGFSVERAGPRLWAWPSPLGLDRGPWERSPSQSVELPEKWLTLKEAAEHLREQYGLRTSHETLKKHVHGGCPSAKNFGKRQVRMTEVIPWLKQQGIIER
jgi:hypothetical protein